VTRYLVTGARGFVGRHLVAQIREADGGAEIVGTGRSHFPLRDTAGLRRLIGEWRPDCVFHLAAATHSAAEPDLIETNVAGTASLMTALSGSHARVVLASSGSVYGDPERLPIAETHPCRPRDVYGATKLAAERIAGDRVVVARIFNVVGPGQDETHVCGRLAAQLASGATRIEVGPTDTTRDFIDVRDVASALFLLAERGRAGETYNVAGGRETSIQAVLSELIRIYGATVEIVRRDGVPAGVHRHVADIARLRQLGFTPSFSLADSLRDAAAKTAAPARAS
jgi:GDP-4-dehydro-6-deoxy-D-mannose reductase